MKPSAFLTLILACTLASGCQTMATSGNSATGSGNGFATSKKAIASPVAGLEAGPMSGSLGQGLDRQSVQKGLEAELAALDGGQTGNPVSWTSSADISGEVIPQQVYQVGDSSCRRYIHKILVNGQSRQATGTACKQPGGAWTALT